MNLNLIYHEDCTITLDRLTDESIDLVVTSPPYYNAREYSYYSSVSEYMEKMKEIFTKIFHKLKNHRVVVINVGDIITQLGKAQWSRARIPLGAYFIIMMEEIGFSYIDNYIWDKGEAQSRRQLGNKPFPFFQNPINAYEHILIFEKNELSKEKIPCPECNEKITLSNSQTKTGVQSWECANPECPAKSKSGRGKRFSARSIMLDELQHESNLIPKEFSQIWRRDIVQFAPVNKIGKDGKDKFGHTAPYPETLVEMAIRFFSGVDDLVYDPFMGSGTTAMVAKRLNRHFIGSEIHEEYIELAESRIIE